MPFNDSYDVCHVLGVLASRELSALARNVPCHRCNEFICLLGIKPLSIDTMLGTHEIGHRQQKHTCTWMPGGMPTWKMQHMMPW